ncbi:MAG: FecR domain-containing protein [bacterium]|nr:FecR domain-containing protein [bacterium]
MSKNRGQAFSVVQTGESEVRDLLRSAGPRPVVPPEDLVEIRAAAKAHWREMVRMERERSRFGRRNTVLALAASVLLAVALGWWLMLEWGGVTPDLVASVELLRGEALVDESKATVGDALRAGAVLETGLGSQTSGMAFRLTGGQSVRLDEGTRVHLTSGSSFDLERGAVYIDTFSAAPGTAVEVSTPYGTVWDVGTQFEVRIGSREAAELTVRVREGEVTLEREGDTDSAQAGEELTLQDGRLGRGAVQAHDEAWAWVDRVTPMMDIEGAPIASYLEWVARETGRELHYSDAALAETAAIETLSGSIEEHTPEESLSILPSSGFGYRIENGSLLIERP